MALDVAFRELSDRLELSDKVVVDGWFHRLVQAYGEPHRHYHTLTHIVKMLNALREFGKDLQHHEEVELAIWFHDAVYDPQRTDNEEASNRLFQQFASDAQLVSVAKKNELNLSVCSRPLLHLSPFVVQ